MTVHAKGFRSKRILNYMVEWCFPQDSSVFPQFGSSWKLVAWVTKRPGNQTRTYAEIVPVLPQPLKMHLSRNNVFITLNGSSAMKVSI